MAVYHIGMYPAHSVSILQPLIIVIVLMKLKADADPEQVKAMTSTAVAMVGVVPG